MTKIIKGAAAALTACLMLTACSGGDDYSSYASAYKKVTANGGMNADFELTLEMDGVETVTNGSFKLDTSDGKSILYYEMDIDGNKVIQFSDGEYIYTEADGHKTRYAINTKPSAGGDRNEVEQKDNNSAGSFNTEAFLSEFSSFLEAGKIKELGLLSPIEKNAVSGISEDGGVYTLTFSESLVKRYLNIIIANESNSTDGDTLQIDELNDFSYKATVSDGIVTGTEYSGVLAVNVPGSLMADGNDADYDMDLNIKITFVDPGSAVEVTLPSTDGYDLIG